MTEFNVGKCTILPLWIVKILCCADQVCLSAQRFGETITLLSNVTTTTFVIIACIRSPAYGFSRFYAKIVLLVTAWCTTHTAKSWIPLWYIYNFFWFLHSVWNTSHIFIYCVYVLMTGNDLYEKNEDLNDYVRWYTQQYDIIQLVLQLTWWLHCERFGKRNTLLFM